MADGDVTGFGPEPVHLGVAVLDAHVGQTVLAGLADRLAEHRRRRVHAQGVPRGSHSAAARVVDPVPQPMSMTRSAPLMAARSASGQ
jgi:hypothetical protein